MPDEMDDTHASLETLDQIRQRAPERMPALDVRFRDKQPFNAVDVLEQQLSGFRIQIRRRLRSQHLAPGRVSVERLV
jgi:hypothetical protein